MALRSGTRLGVYEVSAQIGEGGMGQVYRARDTKLNRDVALKVLPEAFAADPDRLARFTREAQTLAALNHPNIAHIHGLEESSEVRALVMELVEGDDLSQRIARGAIPLAEALPIATQIAGALEAAHERGIIHRDLKPANIKVRPDGVVKMLDFGLAKLSDPTASSGQDDATRASEALTVTSPAMMTGVGVLLGTASYMSPEQARGMPVDSRTDIWAFGCVLHEMLGGRRTFTGQTISDTIAKILEREPDWRALPDSTPDRIRRLLRRCLQKDVQRRLDDIADARSEIEKARAARDARRGSSRSRSSSSTPRRSLSASGRVSSPPGGMPPIRQVRVSVLIADIRNDTGDPVFDRALEPIVKSALETSTFVVALGRTHMGVPPGETLDEVGARALAVKEGLGVVLCGSIDRQGTGYDVTIKATHTITDSVIANETGWASGKDAVLKVTTQLVTNVRRALGDPMSDSVQLFANFSLSTTSLEAVHFYSAAQEAAADGKFEDARLNAARAVELDPTFGVGHEILAVALHNLGRRQDAEKYIKEALRHLDGMTERERFSARGMFFRLTGDFRQGVKEYRDLVALYEGDIVGHNQLAMCFIHLREFRKAVDEMRKVVEIVPHRATFRVNLSLYSSYAGDCQSGEREARLARDLGNREWALFALAIAQVGQGRLSQAKDSYQELARVNARESSRAASGLGDLAIYEGRFSDAIRILEAAAEADHRLEDAERAADKFAALAYARLLQGQNGLGLESARRALAASEEVETRFEAARLCVEIGELADAETIVSDLASDLRTEAGSYTKIIEAGIALRRKSMRQGIKLLTEANELLDTWIGHFDLGRAYLEAGQFAQADSEFDRCIKRRCELLSDRRYSYLPRFTTTRVVPGRG